MRTKFFALLLFPFVIFGNSNNITFKDFTASDNSGKSHHISSYLHSGKHVVLHFTASF